MKIVLTGVETVNKGAELMLYGILQEVEKKYPDAEIYLKVGSVKQGLDYIDTKLKLHFWPIGRAVQKYHINGILHRLNLPMVIDSKAVNADYLIDASGFLFSDQCNLWGTTPKWWDSLLRKQRYNNAKIIFLPQAFGPFENENTRKALSIIGQYSNVIMAREKTSYNYIKESGLVDMNKVRVYKDFTSLVEGVFPPKYNHLRNGICIIPNINMIEQKKINYQDYIDLLSRIIDEGNKSNRPVYLLNHEGDSDEELALKCQKSVGGNIEVVTGLNGLEVKGLIASSFLVITSRFHGLASAFNSCVPCLATSWSHKYEEFFKDYNVENCVLPLNDLNEVTSRLNIFLDETENENFRKHLREKLVDIKKQTREMWDYIWSL